MSWREAVEQGDLDALSSYLGAHSNDTADFTESGTLLTPLHYAAQSGHLPIVSLLLDCDPPAPRDATDRFNRTPLYLSVLHRHPDISRLLLKHNADPNILCQCGTSPMSKAAEHGDRRTISLLVDAGATWNTANADGETPQELASRNGHEIPWAGHERRQREKLKRAVTSGDAVLVRDLIQAGANPAGRPSPGAATVLEVACQGGKMDVVRVLLQTLSASGSTTESMGSMALHEAAKKGHTGLVELLLDTGFSANARDADQMTPLHRAAARGHMGVANVLLRRDAAGVLARGVNEVTPLHQAAMQGKADMVRFLLSKNADPKAEDGEGRTPRDRASGDAVHVFE
ncbi:hypothetical protein CEP53_000455 [Fusarium sp. AF-6]|nr:hypothetical protein CEP53_000455 [Fusarium sp. AF-6]